MQVIDMLFVNKCDSHNNLPTALLVKQNVTRLHIEDMTTFLE